MGYHKQTFYGFQIKSSDGRAFPVRAGSRENLNPGVMRLIARDKEKTENLPERIKTWVDAQVASGKLSRDEAVKESQAHFFYVFKEEEKKERALTEERARKEKAKGRWKKVRTNGKKMRVWAQDKTFLIMNSNGDVYLKSFSDLVLFGAQQEVKLNHLLCLAYGSPVPAQGWKVETV